MKNSALDRLDFNEPSDRELEELERQEKVFINEAVEETGDDIVLKYFSGLGEYKALSFEELHLRIISAKNGSQVDRDIVIVANLRLVITVAKRYKNVSHSLTLLDLIQCGNIGLFKAIRKFDWTRGFKFSTYAIWWIRQTITKEISDFSRVVKVPRYRVELFSIYSKVSKELSKILGRKAKIGEIAKVMLVSKEDLKNLLKEMKEIKYLQDNISDEEDSAEFGDMIEDEKVPTMEDVMDLRMVSSGLQEIINTFSPKEKEVLVFRYMDNLSNEEISRRLNMSPKKIQHIRKKIQKKFESSPFSYKFIKFLKERKF